MAWVWPMSIRQRLALAFALMLLAALLQAGAGLWSAGRLAAVADESVQRRLPSSIHIGRLAAPVAEFRIAQFQYTLAPDSERKDLEAKMSAALAEIATAQQGLRSGHSRCRGRRT